MAATVVIIDDVAAVRVLLRTALEAESDFVVVGDAGTVDAGATLVRATQPDAVVIDLSMEETGSAPLAVVRQACPAARVVVFSAHPPEADASRVKAAGADAYVQKGTSLQELVAALRQVLRVLESPDPPEPDPLAAVVAHGMLGTAAVLQGAAAMLTHRWDRLTNERRDDLFELLRSQLDQLRDGVTTLPAVIAHRVLNELVGLFEVVEQVTTGDATHRSRIALFELADSSLPRVVEILKSVVAGLPPEAIAHLDRLRDSR
jgi:DNA-binding response OmpR family regulator